MTDTTVIITEAIKEAAKSEPIHPGWFAIVAFLAFVAHLLKKAKRLEDKADAAGIPFYFGQFLLKEKYTIGASLCCIIISVIANEEISEIHIASVIAGEFIFIVFAGIGWLSDSLMDMVFGGYDGYLKKQINKLKG